MVKLVCISDTHNKQDQLDLPEGDILIHAGDLTGIGRLHEFESVGNWFKEQKKKFKHIIIIAGNHDFGLDNWHKEEALKMFDKEIIYLEHQPCRVMGINIFGSAYTPIFNQWAFMRDDAYELPRLWDMIPDRTELLITHGPPKGILDKTLEGENVGSKTLYNKVKKLPKLKLHVYGHIHEAYGHEKVDNIDFYNVSSVNRNYQLVNKPVVIEYTK